MASKNVLDLLTIANGEPMSAIPVQRNFKRIESFHNILDWETIDTVKIATFANNTFGSSGVASNPIGANMFDLIDDFLKRTVFSIQYVSATTIRILAVVSSIINGKARRITVNLDLDITVDLDADVEAPSTRYYIYLTADAAATTFLGKLSVSPTVPTVITSYLKIGEFYNNAASDIDKYSIITYDGKYQDYGMELANKNSGVIPSIEYVSATTVRIVLGTSLVINGIKRRISANVDIDISGAGLDTGAEAGSTMYYIYVVADTAGLFAGYVSASSAFPSPGGVPATNYLKIGEVYNNAASNFVQGSVKTYDQHYQYTRGDKKNLRIEKHSCGITNGNVSGTWSWDYATNHVYHLDIRCSSLPTYGASIQDEYYYSYSSTANDFTITLNKVAASIDPHPIGVTATLKFQVFAIVD